MVFWVPHMGGDKLGGVGMVDNDSGVNSGNRFNINIRSNK